MTTRDNTPMQTEPAEWVNLRDKQGRVQGRYCPRLQLLIIQERKVQTPHDLSKYHQGIDGSERAC